MKVLITGAGVAGLSAAIFLEKKGIEVKLIERTHEASHPGFVLYLYPSATKYMKELGIYDQVRAESQVLNSLKVFDKQKRFLVEFDYKQFNKGYGGENLLLERGTLHSSLLNRYGKDRVFWQTEIHAIDEDEKDIEVTYRDGTKEKFDLIIGADGINSSLRSHYFSSDEIHTYHAYTWIYWLGEKFKRPKNIEVYIGKSSSIMLLPVGDKCAVYLVTLSDEGADFIDEDLYKKEFADYKDPIPEIVKSLAYAKHIYKTPLRHIETQEWHRGRTVLIGDAIHAMSPFSGMGSTMAMHDAYVLADELAKDYPDYRDALNMYQARRKDNVEKAKRVTNLAMELTTQFSKDEMNGLLYYASPLINMFTKRTFKSAIADFIKE
jgi:2-polyprenyl-6-methoxyphenol hydroxylase-like FAD-dependent oxidoreductase